MKVRETPHSKTFFSLSSLLLLTLFIYFLLVLSMFFVLGENKLIDTISLSLTTILVCILWFFLWIGRKTKNSLIILWVLIFFIFYLLRISYWIVDPYSLHFGYIGGSSADVNRALVYVCAGSLVLGLALILSQRKGGRVKVISNLMENPSDRRNTLHSLSPKLLVLLGFLIFALHMVIYLKFGWGRRAEIELPVAGWLLRFVDWLALLMVMFASIGDRWRNLRRSDKVVFFLFCIIFIGYKVITGSRAAIFILFLLWVFLQIALHRDVLISRKTFVMLILLAFLSIPVYIVATEVRYKAMLTPEYKSKSLSVTEVVKEALSERKYTEGVFRQISERLSMLDRLAMLMSPQGASMKRYLNIENILKSTSNRLVPGEFFPEILLLNRYYNVVFCGWSPEYAKTNYSSEIFTNFGEYYILFGWLGGLLAIFIIGYIMGWLYVKIDQSKSRYRFLFLLFFFFQFYSWLGSFGTDTFIYLIWGQVLSIILYIGLAKFIGVVLMPSYRIHTVR